MPNGELNEPALVEHGPRAAPPDTRGQYDTVFEARFVT